MASQIDWAEQCLHQIIYDSCGLFYPGARTQAFPSKERSAVPSKSAPAEGVVSSLSKGIQALKVIASSPHPLTAAAVAGEIGASRATTYRLLRTLSLHELVTTTADGRYTRGRGLGPLAAATQRSLRQLAAPSLRSLADQTGLTAFVAMQDEGECVTLLSATPEGFATSLAQAPGARHAVSAGAPGKAILSIIPRAEWPVDEKTAGRLEQEVESAWKSGFCVSNDEVLPGVSSVAVPFQVAGERPCAVALLYTDQSLDPAQLAARLKQAAVEIEGRA